MKCMSLMFSVVIASAALTGPLLGTSNAAIFTASYTGDALPQDAASNPQFTKVLDSDVDLSPPAVANESVSDGILTVHTEENRGFIEYRLDGGPESAWNPTGAGTTIELKLKVDHNSPGADWAGTILVGTGNRFWALVIGTGFISDLASGGDLAINTSDAFHTYRLVIADEANGPLSIYVDGSTTAARSWAGADSTANRLSFGDLTGNESGQIQWDSIEWTNAVAEAPVPEPSTFALAVIGATGLLRRRRSVAL